MCQDWSLSTKRVYGGLSADDRQRARQGELIEAAIGLMGEHGVGRLTVRDVADAAGVSTRYVYESFADLADLRAKAFDQTANEVVTVALDAVRDAEPDLSARVEALLRALLRYSDEHPDRARLVLTDAYGDPALTAKRHQMSRGFAVAFAQLVALHLPGDISRRRLRLATRMLVGATAEIVTARLDLGPREFDRHLIADMRDMFLAMLTAVDQPT